jgi:carbamoyltransferase
VKVLGVNAVFHDPAAAIVVDGAIVGAAEEERFSRRKHGKPCVPFSTWELPELAARWCLEHAGVRAADLDAVAYSYDPALASPVDGDVTHEGWEPLRTLYASRAPQFLATALPGLRPEVVRFVPHHIAHAASAAHAGPFESCAVMVLDGRGEHASYLAARFDGERLDVVDVQPLPHSLGLFYEEVTEHLGFRRSSDEYKVMALAAYGSPRFLPELRAAVRHVGPHRFACDRIDWSEFTAPVRGGALASEHADLASSVQHRLQEMLLELAEDLYAETAETRLAFAGGVALNCVANTWLHEHGPFDEIWVQPAAGDAGTALGAALQVAAELEGRPETMQTAALGRSWSDREIREALQTANVPFEDVDDPARPVAEALARNEVVAWFHGRSEFGPRALGHRSLLAHPGREENVARLNDVKGREQFRPVAPVVLASRAGEIFEGGPLPSPFMLFTHTVRDEWRSRIPAVVHVDGTARAQTVDPRSEPLLARLLERFDELTGLPVLVNTSLNTDGRPMVDDPRDALECFGSAPIDLLSIGGSIVRRHG